jgi:adenine-specific DNA-methyltransferase
MPTVLDGLLDRVPDVALRAAIRREVEILRNSKQFGLVFESHLPEVAMLKNHPIRRGAHVQRRTYGGSDTGLVTRLTGETATVKWAESEEDVPTAELVVVAQFGQPVFPGFRSLNRIERGSSTPFHVVINSENFHALEALAFSHRDAVDVIYIDPPYNTGKRAEWRYSDRWVSKEDRFRHSKWLSFMERRLRLARPLLRKDGLLFISIDDHEYHHLRTLCDQVFGEECWISTFIWRTDGNIDNQAQIKSNHEYILCLSLDPASTRISGTIDPNIVESSKLHTDEIRNSVIKNGPKNPISSVELPVGFPAAFEEGVIPARQNKWPHFDSDILVKNFKTTNSVEVKSGWANASLMQTFISQGLVPVIDRKGQETVFVLTATGTIENVKRRAGGQHHVLTVLFNMGTTEVTSNALKKMGVSFTYPKPIPLLRYLIGLHPNPNAVVLDFFAGSGSTAQATMELNASDGGRRQSILVTNNEVEEKAAIRLASEGHAPGDAQWESEGIFKLVTKPRVETVVTGLRADGARYSDGLDENVEFLELCYLDPNTVARGRAFAAIAPLLWLRARASGPCIREVSETYALPDGATYGVLFDPSYIRELVAELNDRDGVELVFIVTDSGAAFRQAVAELPAHVRGVRLYEDYLHNFEINRGEPL